TRTIAEATIASAKLVEVQRWGTGGFGGEWSGRNSTGQISLRVFCPTPLDEQHNTVIVIFQPNQPEHIAELILSSLLSKAYTVKVDGATSVTLDSYESIGTCNFSRRLTVGFNGTLIQHSATTTCPAR